MLESWVHPDYDHLYIQLTSKNANSSHKPIFFLEIALFFVLSLLFCGSVFLEVWNLLTTSKQIERNLKLWKTWSLAHSAHSFVSHFQCFKVGEIIGSKYGHLMLRGVFPDKLTLILIYRRSSSSMWCSSCKNTFVGASSLQMIANKYWCEYMCTVSGLSFMCSFSFLRNCSM